MVLGSAWNQQLMMSGFACGRRCRARRCCQGKVLCFYHALSALAAFTHQTTTRDLALRHHYNSVSGHIRNVATKMAAGMIAVLRCGFACGC